MGRNLHSDQESDRIGGIYLNILFSTGCPRCLELKSLLERANITYTLVSDVKTILNAGIDRVPVLQVDDTKMEIKEAKEWIISQNKENKNEE